MVEVFGVLYKELFIYVGEDGYFSMFFEFDYVDLDVGKEGKWYEMYNWNFFDFKKVIFDS